MSSSKDKVADHGELFILSGPSGSGKTTLIRRLLEGQQVERLAFSVSHTTRRPRCGEETGRDYHFVTEATFEEMIEDERFLEWARVHDHHYGTALDEVLPRLDGGVDVVMDIDVQGARKVLDDSRSKLAFKRVHGVFVVPPSYRDLKARLLARDLDAAEAIERRLAAALQEILSFENYEYVIVNDDAEAASAALASIIIEKRHRRERVRDRIAVVLEDFSRAGS